MVFFLIHARVCTIIAKFIAQQQQIRKNFFSFQMNKRRRKKKLVEMVQENEIKCHDKRKLRWKCESDDDNDKGMKSIVKNQDVIIKIQEQVNICANSFCKICTTFTCSDFNVKT